MRDLWAQIEALDARVEAQTQIRMLLDARKLVERATRWLLRNRRPPLDVAATVSYFAGSTAELSERILELLPHGDREVLEDRKSTRLNSSHANISYAVFCLKKKKTHII